MLLILLLQLLHMMRPRFKCCCILMQPEVWRAIMIWQVHSDRI